MRACNKQKTEPSLVTTLPSVHEHRETLKY